jgi:hypothetical protein
LQVFHLQVPLVHSIHYWSKIFKLFIFWFTSSSGDYILRWINADTLEEGVNGLLPAGNWFIRLDSQVPLILKSQDTATYILYETRLTSDYEVTPITSIGANDGIITFTNTAGLSGNYEFSINDGATWQVSNIFNNLAPGSYTLKVRNADQHIDVITLETVELEEAMEEWMTWFNWLWIEGETAIQNGFLVPVIGDTVNIVNKDFTENYIPGTSQATFNFTNPMTVPTLIGEDYERFLIKYDNQFPHHVRMIGNFKPDFTPTQQQIDELHTRFQLYMFWSGELNDNGVVKENRTINEGDLGFAYVANGAITNIDPVGVSYDTNKFVVPFGVYSFLFTDDGVDYSAVFNGTTWTVTDLTPTGENVAYDAQGAIAAINPGTVTGMGY